MKEDHKASVQVLSDGSLKFLQEEIIKPNSGAKKLNKLISVNVIDEDIKSIKQVPHLFWELSHMNLILTNACNLSCTYCYEQHRKDYGRFTEESLSRAYKFLVNTSRAPHKTFQFFGGEPLIHKDLILSFLSKNKDYLQEQSESFPSTIVSLITNGLLLDSSFLKEYFSSVSIEIYPMDTFEYLQLIQAGVDGLALYQETYDRDTYRKYHLRGVKKDMDYRLNGPDRGGLAEFRKIGIGALLGLADPLGEMFFLGLHASHLLKKYWKTSLQISLPRMRPAKGDFHSVVPVSDREFTRFLFALRIYFKDIGIVLSTRESASLRNNLIGLGITTMSAESKTEPGGYSESGELEQFETEDKRSLTEVIRYIRVKGFDPILKDFDNAIV